MTNSLINKRFRIQKIACASQGTFRTSEPWSSRGSSTAALYVTERITTGDLGIPYSCRLAASRDLGIPYSCCCSRSICASERMTSWDLGIPYSWRRLEDLGSPNLGLLLLSFSKIAASAPRDQGIPYSWCCCRLTTRDQGIPYSWRRLLSYILCSCAAAVAAGRFRGSTCFKRCKAKFAKIEFAQIWLRNWNF